MPTMWILALLVTAAVALDLQVHMSQSFVQHKVLEKPVRIDAAVRFDSKLYLISGDEAMVLDEHDIQEKIIERGTTDDNGVKIPATDQPIQAAVRWPRKDIVYFYGPDSSIKVNLATNETIEKHYGKTREFLQDGGPDAVAFMSRTFYIFRGCQYVAQTGTLWKLGEPRNISDLALPCNIDAAWTDEEYNTVTVLKGDKIWHWMEEDFVVGPFDFARSYVMKDWVVKPYETK